MNKKAEVGRGTVREKDRVIGKTNPNCLAEDLIAPVVPKAGGAFNFCIRIAPLRQCVLVRP